MNQLEQPPAPGADAARGSGASHYDVVVIGGTAAGVAAAFAAARDGASVLLVEASQHLGGLMTSGLGRTDIGPRMTIGGLFRRLMNALREHYVTSYGPGSPQVKDCHDGYSLEPSVAERYVNRLLEEQGFAFSRSGPELNGSKLELADGSRARPHPLPGTGPLPSGHSPASPLRGEGGPKAGVGLARGPAASTLKPLAGTTRNGEPETRNARDVWLGWRLAWEGGPSLLEGGRWLVETAPGAGPDRPDGTPERTVTAVTLAAVDSAGRATGEQRRVTATVFVDATYEGDVALGASATYRIGREGREEFGEPHAGVLYQDFRTKLCYPGSTGAADRRVQAYNYRLCLTRDPSNRRPIPRPARYDRARYASQVADVQRGQNKAFMGWGSVGVLNQATLPNGKTDCNNHHYAFLSTDWPEASFAYAEAGPERRLAIAQAHREYLEGLVWFCQHDPALPEWFRTEARERGYAADEFQDNGGFPRQMYVREAARIAGDYVFSARDASRAPDGGRAPVHWDSIASGGYGIDSHATRQREDLALPPETDAHDGRRIALEGFMSISSAPYQLPYRIMLPQGIDGLLVPVAVSATHLGFGTIRMEPTWMALGEAAGTAAALAVARGVRLRDVPRAELQRRLVDRGAVIIYFEDLAPAGFTGHEALPPDLSPAVQFWGTHGFFATYQAEAAAPLTRGGGRPVALAGPARLRSLAPAAGGPGGLRRRRADHARRLPRAGTPVATRTVAAAPGAGGRDPPGGAGPAGSAQPGRRLPHALPDLRTPPVEHAELRRTRRSYLPSRARSTTTSHLSC